jgi:DNA-binding NarL/FixJ family response regulator
MAAACLPRPRRLSPGSESQIGRSIRSVAVGVAVAERTGAVSVTPKTVELHVTKAYRKLGIRSRRELHAAFAAA